MRCSTCLRRHYSALACCRSGEELHGPLPTLSTAEEALASVHASVTRAIAASARWRGGTPWAMHGIVTTGGDHTLKLEPAERMAPAALPWFPRVPQHTEGYACAAPGYLRAQKAELALDVQPHQPAKAAPCCMLLRARAIGSTARATRPSVNVLRHGSPEGGGGSFHTCLAAHHRVPARSSSRGHTRVRSRSSTRRCRRRSEPP
jgi:hypothetical protein